MHFCPKFRKKIGYFKNVSTWSHTKFFRTDVSVNINNFETFKVYDRKLLTYFCSHFELQFEFNEVQECPRISRTFYNCTLLFFYFRVHTLGKR